MSLTKSPNDKQCDGEVGQLLQNVVQEEVGGNIQLQ